MVQTDYNSSNSGGRKKRVVSVHQGLFIAIEGSDGSGKGTQFKLLVERLNAAGYDVSTYDFPQYERESSYFVREYLNGTYGSAQAVGPYTPSVFYALDRYSVAAQIIADLTAGKVVVSNRFTGSSMAHQGTKFSSPEEREAFFSWIEQLEFNMLGIPKPDINLVLLVPADVAQKLVDQKEKRSYTTSKRDLHEADLGHLERAVETFQQLLNVYDSFAAIDCSEDGELLSIPTVNNLIWERIEPMFGRLSKKNKHKAAIADTKQVTDKHDEEVSAKLKAHLELIALTQQKLAKHLGDSATDVLNLIQPITERVNQAQNERLRSLAQEKNLQPIKGDGENIVTLLDHWPKNEAEIITQIVYPYSTLSLKELSSEVSRWSYEEKTKVLSTYLTDELPSQVTYHFEFITSYNLYKSLAGIGSTSTQAITPFYGFNEVPELDDPEVESLVNQGFESSMSLIQALQASGNEDDIETACLSGHKLRWQLNLSLTDLKKLVSCLTELDTQESSDLYQAINQVLSEVHPSVTQLLSV